MGGKTTPSGFGSDVTRANNLQNRIEPRDFVAQDPEQRRIRQEMTIEGVDYQFVRSEETNATPKSCELIEVTTALACASADSNLAAAIFKKYGSAKRSQPIETFSASFKPVEIDALAEVAYEKFVDAIQINYANKFLAVLFKNPSMSKRVFEFATS